MIDRTSRVALGLALLALALAFRPPARAQQGPDDDPDRAERLAEAKLEIDVLKGRMEAKQAEVKVEEGRVELARMNKENAERFARLKFGRVTYLREATNALLFAESRAVARRAEAREAKARYEEARRRHEAGQVASAPEDAEAERLARAREELDLLESKMAAKQAETKLAAGRIALARTLQANAEENLRTHHIEATPMTVQEARIAALQAESRAAAKQAELAEATARYELARRRLASGHARGPDPPEDRIEALERRLDEVSRKFDALEDRLISHMNDANAKK